MNYNTSEEKEIGKKLSSLKFKADEYLYFIPEDIYSDKDGEFIYPESTTDVIKTFKNENQTIKYLPFGNPLLISRKSADWFGPTIFVGFSILINNPQLIDIALNILANHILEIFKGSTGNKTVKFDIIIETEKNKTFKKISYNGTSEGIEKLGSLIKKLRR